MIRGLGSNLKIKHKIALQKGIFSLQLFGICNAETWSLVIFEYKRAGLMRQS
jgi:hypothetical protein